MGPKTKDQKRTAAANAARRKSKTGLEPPDAELWEVTHFDRRLSGRYDIVVFVWPKGVQHGFYERELEDVVVPEGLPDLILDDPKVIYHLGSDTVEKEKLRRSPSVTAAAAAANLEPAAAAANLEPAAAAANLEASDDDFDPVGGNLGPDDDDDDGDSEAPGDERYLMRRVEASDDSENETSDNENEASDDDFDPDDENEASASDDDLDCLRDSIRRLNVQSVRRGGAFSQAARNPMPVQPANRPPQAPMPAQPANQPPQAPMPAQPANQPPQAPPPAPLPPLAPAPPPQQALRAIVPPSFFGDEYLSANDSSGSDGDDDDDNIPLLAQKPQKGDFDSPDCLGRHDIDYWEVSGADQHKLVAVMVKLGWIMDVAAFLPKVKTVGAWNIAIATAPVSWLVLLDDNQDHQQWVNRFCFELGLAHKCACPPRRNVVHETKAFVSSKLRKVHTRTLGPPTHPPPHTHTQM